MNASPSKEEFEQAATELAISPSMIEKDWHVVQLLAFLSRQSFPGFDIIFSGGTALSKAHGLIQRFSEDVDFRVIANLEGSRTEQGKKLSSFKNAVIEALHQEGFKVSNLDAKNENKYFTANIEYNTQFDPHDALRPHIKLEVTVGEPQLPAMQMPVASFVTKLIKRPPEVTSIACIDPVETAADKMSALAWRIPNRDRTHEQDDPAVVRHIHDLAVLENRVEKDMRFPALVIASMQSDNNTRLKNKPASDLSNAEKFAHMLDILAKDDEYRKEYDQFVRGVSYATEGMEPDFNTALEAVRRLVEVVLSTGKKS